MGKIHISSIIRTVDGMYCPEFSDDPQIGSHLEVISTLGTGGCLFSPQLQGEGQIRELVVSDQRGNQRSEAHGLSSRCSEDGDYS